MLNDQMAELARYRGVGCIVQREGERERERDRERQTGPSTAQARCDGR